jgi:hypothetical protein
MGAFMKGNDDLTAGLWCQVAEQLADWHKFVDHYESCGGPQIDETEYAFCVALTYMRTTTGTNMAVANLRFHKSTEYKELLLGLQFVPKMMKTAYNNTV